MSRRISACGALAMMIAIANGLPIDASADSNSGLQCTDDGAMQALQVNLASAEQFCGSYANYVKPTAVAQATQIQTVTHLIGGVTEVVTTTSTPTMFMTVMGDYALQSAVTVTSASCPVTSVAAAAAVAATSAPPSRGGSGSQVPSRGGGGIGKAEAAKRDAQPEKAGPESENQYPKLMHRAASSLPGYISQYPASQISSACSCLASSQATGAAITSQTTVTSNAATVTQIHTTVDVAVVKYVSLGNTAPAQTVCVVAQ